MRKATLSDHDVVADALTSAFLNDPLFIWMMRTSRGREQRVRSFFKLTVAAELAKQIIEVYVTGDGSGAAVWRGEGDRGMSPLEQLRSAPTLVRIFGSGIGRSFRASVAMEKVHPAEPHRYLFLLGVHQASRGQGLGSTLLAPALESSDAEGLPAYLENSNPANTAFYARHGFVQRGTIILPKGAPPLIPMWREPR